MSTVRPYMSELVFEELTKLYSNKKEAVDRAVSAFLLMRRLTLRELNGVFTEQERTGMVASFNGTIIGFNLGVPPKFMLKAQMEDAVALEGADAMYGFDAEQLLGKIDGLSELQAMYLLEECHRFWNEVGEKDVKLFLVER